MSDELLEQAVDSIVEDLIENSIEEVEEAEKPFEPFVTINDERIEIKKLSASKVATISNIFGELLINGNKKLREYKAADNMAFIVGILAALDEKSLIRLAACLVERDEQFAKENFDLGWVLEALGIQMQVSNLRAIITNFTSLLSRLQ